MATKKAATAKRPRKVTGVKKTAKKSPAKAEAAEPSSNGTATVTKAKGKAELDPNQPQLPGFQEDRVPAVEKIIKLRASHLSKISAMQEEIKAAIAKLPDLFKKNKLTQYTASGVTVSVHHGADEVVFKKAKANK
jgi:uncharacterized membrane protein YqiK